MDICSVEGCERKKYARTFCRGHHGRWSANGSAVRLCPTCGKDKPIAYGPSTYCGDACVPMCSAPECKRKAIGSIEYCATHQSSIYKHGRLPEYTWAEEKLCLICGKTEWEGKGRTTCSGACTQALRRKSVERTKKCFKCSTIIDISMPLDGSRKPRSDVLLCKTCGKTRRLRHGTSATVLADLNGTDCGICKTPIDMDLAYPVKWCVSIDHKIPVARGGTHEVENLQLAHLHCNLVKQARVDYVA